MSDQTGQGARKSSAHASPDQPLTIDVVIAVYNGATYLAATLESVFLQTLQPAMVIVVDDGSTDDSVEIVASSEFNGRITIVPRTNGGQSAARNTGVAYSTASLIAFLDQDDIWYPNHLELLMKKFTRDAAIGWAYSDFDEIDSDGLLVSRRFHRSQGQQHPRDTLADLVSQDLMALPTATVVRADAFRSVGGFDESLVGYEDDDLFIRMFRAHWLPAYVSDSTVQFRQHGGSSSRSSSFSQSRMRFLDKLQAQLPADRRLNRYYFRDLVVPRMFQTTLNEYVTCLPNSEFAEAAALGELATRIAARNEVSARRRVWLWLLRKPQWYRRVLRFRGLLPRSIRERLLLGHVYRAHS